MLDHAQRTAILELHRQGVGKRTIARSLGVSRSTVRRVIGSTSSAVPPIDRTFKAEPHRERILELYATCKGNLVRVHEELVAEGAELSYQALTGFCRRAGIGQKERVPAGRYHFDPGEEMQHDTSPHDVVVDGKRRRAQTASLVLCYSRILFFQLYPRFTRFDCKLFLAEGLRYVGGACRACMIDNTHLVVLRGTGAEMIPVPEMASFAERYGFEFRAHERGDANRSARVERPFDYIENNFLAGRSFTDWDDTNRQARAWCDRVNGSFRRHLHASPRELFVTERPRLTPLPLWVPEPYLLHHRIVDTEGYVSVNTNRYSVPPRLIGRRVEVRETARQIEVYEGPRRVADHRRQIDPTGQRHTLSEHRPARGQGARRRDPPPEKKQILEAVPEIGDYVTALEHRGPGRGTLALRRLLQMVREYPRPPLLRAIHTAGRYGLYDLERVERMVLREIAGEYFVLRDPDPGDEDGE